MGVGPRCGIQSRSFGAALHETAEGVHRPFTATALALAELEGDGCSCLPSTFGSGTCDLAQNRDAWDEDSGQFVTGFNPDGEPDDTVLVARVSADDDPDLMPPTLHWAHQALDRAVDRLYRRAGFASERERG